MTPLKIPDLLHALNNTKNEAILDTTTMDIQAKKNDMLQKLQLPREKLKKMHKALRDYKYVDELHDIHIGRYIRWISLNNPANIFLTTGGIICDLKLTKDDIHIICKNNMNRLFTVKLNECLIVQKLTPQEKVILSAVNHLATK